MSRIPAVLYVLPSLGLGGAERQAVTLARALKKEGWEVTFALLGERDDLHDWLERVDIEVLKFPRLGKIGIKGIFGLWRYIARTRPAIVHTFLFDADVIGRFAKLFSPNTVVVNSERFTVVNRPLRHRLAEKLTVRLPDHLIANSKDGKAFAEQHRGFRADRVSVVYNGIDEEVFKLDHDRQAVRAELGLRDGDIAVLRTANIRFNKNYELLLEIVEELRADGRFKFLCAGDIIPHPHAQEKLYAEAIKQKLVSADPELGLKLLGHRNDVQKILVAADVSLCTSRLEGFPNSILEAAYAGLPVLTTPVSGVDELVVEGQTGWVIDDDRPPEFADRLKQLADDPELRHRMGKNAAMRTRELFGSRALAKNTLAVYENLLLAKARS